MSHLYAGQVIARYPGGPVARAILAALALHMDHRRPDKPVAVAAARLAELAKVSLRDTRYALQELRRDGYIVPLGRGPDGRGLGGRRVVTPYVVVVGKLMAQPDRSKARSGEVPPIAPTDCGRVRHARLTANRTGSTQETVQPVHGLGTQKGATEAPKPCNGGHQNRATGAHEQGLLQQGLNKGTADANAEPPAPIATSPPVRNTGTTNPRPNGADAPPPDVNPGLQKEDQPMPDDADQFGRIPMPDHIRAQIAAMVKNTSTRGPRPPAPPRRVNGDTDGPPPPDLRPTAREAAEKARQAQAVARKLAAQDAAITTGTGSTV